MFVIDIEYYLEIIWHFFITLCFYLNMIACYVLNEVIKSLVYNPSAKEFIKSL